VFHCACVKATLCLWQSRLATCSKNMMCPLVLFNAEIIIYLLLIFLYFSVVGTWNNDNIVLYSLWCVCLKCVTSITITSAVYLLNTKIIVYVLFDSNSILVQLKVLIVIIFLCCVRICIYTVCYFNVVACKLHCC
jgi:hypothetical protein